jgi:hypothetical protein
MSTMPSHLVAGISSSSSMSCHVVHIISSHLYHTMSSISYHAIHVMSCCQHHPYYGVVSHIYRGISSLPLMVNTCWGHHCYGRCHSGSLPHLAVTAPGCCHSWSLPLRAVTVLVHCRSWSLPFMIINVHGHCRLEPSMLSFLSFIIISTMHYILITTILLST